MLIHVHVYACNLIVMYIKCIYMYIIHKFACPCTRPLPQTSVDGVRLVSELTHCVARQTGFDAVMRVRASTGG